MNTTNTIKNTVKKVRTSVNTLGYYVSLPPHLEEMLGSYLEKLTKPQQWIMLFVLVAAMESETPDPVHAIGEGYELCDGELPDEILDVLQEIGNIQKKLPGTIEALCEALVMNIRHTSFATELVTN